jgi:predicted RNA binding protein YcfA (HicA-like mRNA interferase family)
MKYSELEKKLCKAGCYFLKEGGNHKIWYSPITNNIFPFSRHKGEEVPKGLLYKILKESGMKL